MDTGLDYGFAVFVRTEGNHEQEPEMVEQPVGVCASYQEARDLQRAIHDTHHDCVIRYQGPSGGGD